MSEIAFHFNVDRTLPYACRLLRKAVNTGARLVVVGPGQVLQALDRELWTFAPLEFIAHCRDQAPRAQRDASPVVLVESLAHEALKELPHDIVVNLGPQVPAGYDTFQRVIEIVSVDETDRAAARERWRIYAQAGHPLVRHDLAAAGAA